MRKLILIECAACRALREAPTPRELEVEALLIEGLQVKEIAARLNLSPKTVEIHRTNLYKKRHVHNIAGLVHGYYARLKSQGEPPSCESSS